MYIQSRVVIELGVLKLHVIMTMVRCLALLVETPPIVPRQRESRNKTLLIVLWLIHPNRVP